MRAAIYARISQDRDGEGLGVDRQLIDCRALAASRGWQVVAEHVDNDVSAYSTKARPEFEVLLRSGVDVAVVWKSDRLARRGKDLQRFLDTGIQLASCTEPEFTGAAGLLALRMVNSFAEYESSVKSERIIRKNRQRAEARCWRSDGSRVFGYTQHGEPHEVEAPLYREAVERVLAGATVSSIVTDWAARGVTTATGSKWTIGNLRRTLQVPRHAGIYTYRGQEMGEGNWEPLVKRERWDLLQQMFTARAPYQRKRVTEHLLTSLARCDACGGWMNGTRRGKAWAEYRCNMARGGCGGVCIRAELLEPAVVEQFFWVVDTPAFRELAAKQMATTDDASALKELVAAETALDRLTADYYEHNAIDRERYLSTKAKLDDRLTTLRTSIDSTHAVAQLTAPSLRDEWEQHGVAWRRALLDLVIERVTVTKFAGRGVDRVHVTWRY